MMRLKITAETLRGLAQSVAREDYITPREDLEIMKNLQQEGAVKEIGEVALALFYQLQKPGTDETGMDPDEQSRRALAKFKAIFGLHDEVPSPMNVAPASGFSQGGAYVRPQEGFELEQQPPEIREVPAPRADPAPAPVCSRQGRKALAQREPKSARARPLPRRNGRRGVSPPALGEYPEAAGGALRGAA